MGTNFRMESDGSATMGGMTALTREPSGKKASTIGTLSSMRRPADPTSFLMM